MSYGPIDSVEHPQPILAKLVAPPPYVEPVLAEGVSSPAVDDGSTAPANEPDIELIPLVAASPAIDVELVPLAATAFDPDQADVTLVTDPLPALEQLRRSRRRWRGVALAGTVAFAVVGVISCLQFAGTFVACRLVGESRQQAARVRDDNARVMQENQRITAELHASVLELRMAQRGMRDHAAKWATYERQINSVLVRADNHQEKRDELVGELREALVRDLGREAMKVMETIRDEADLQHAHLETAIFLHYYLMGQGVDPLALSVVPQQEPPMNPFVRPPDNDEPGK